MSIGESSSLSKLAPAQSGQSGSSSSSSRQNSLQQISIPPKNKTTNCSISEPKHQPPEECQTWYQFKQLWEGRLANENVREQFTLNERINTTRQAQGLAVRAIRALESNIRKSQRSDLQRTRNHLLDHNMIAEIREDKQTLDQVLVALIAEVGDTKPTERTHPSHLEGLDQNTTMIIQGLREESIELCAERRRNRRRPGRSGLVDGLQILDDYTQVKIAEFDRKIAAIERKSQKICY